jgi:hypothetical protein
MDIEWLEKAFFLPHSNVVERTKEKSIAFYLIGKYVVGRQIFVDRRLVDRLLSKNFRRHDTSSKFFCRHKHAEVEELLRVLNFFKFQTIQLLYLGSEGERDNYKTTSDKVRVKAKIFKLDHTKWGWGRKSGARINDFYTTKIFCRQNVLSTKCSVNEMLIDESLSTKCFDKNFVDEMLFDKSVIRRKT